MKTVQPRESENRLWVMFDCSAVGRGLLVGQLISRCCRWRVEFLRSAKIIQLVSQVFLIYTRGHLSQKFTSHCSGSFMPLDGLDTGPENP